MKHLISFLLCLTLLVSMPLSASASKLMPGLKDAPAKNTSLYTDPETGNTLTIPSDWKISQVSGDPVAKAEFSHTKDSSAVIQYGSTDMWSTLSSAMQKKISREEFDNDMYTASDIADLIGTDAKRVRTEPVGGTDCFWAEKGKQVFFFYKVTDTYLIHVENGWMYVYAFSGSMSQDKYGDFLQIVDSATYAQPENAAEETLPAPATDPAPADAEIYAEAVEAYEDGRYYTAKDLFSSISGYSDSQKYLRLIRIRNYGSNTGIGCVYNFSKALTDSEKEEVDQAAKDFYFADTAEVLLCNTDVACYYLFGDWITASNSSPYAYFKLHKDASGGYYYTRSTNLSNAVSDCVSIIDGEVRISITSSNTLVFSLALTAPDCMEIYSHETCKSFTLYRN